MTQRPTYTIGKLAEKAETTPRTIRYYQEQGLLPAPTIQGKYSHYSETHLQRLRLIQKLKAAFLPLASIREQMEELTDAEVNALLARCLPSEEEEKPQPLADVSVGLAEPVPLGKRAAYLTQVLEVSGQTVSPPAPTNGERLRRALIVSPHLDPNRKSVDQPSVPVEESETPSFREAWERILLAPGVELHVRIPAAPHERQILEQRIAAAKALFETER